MNVLDLLQNIIDYFLYFKMNMLKRTLHLQELLKKLALTLLTLIILAYKLEI